MRISVPNRLSGFTLLELVITIALAGLIMMMIVPFFQSGITTSHRPALWLQDAVTIQKTMENINANYGSVSTPNSTALQALSTSIGAAGSTTYTNSFGTYKVLENRFITFNSSGAEQSGGTSVLKITICSSTNAGDQLTQLFTVQVSH